MILKTVLGLPDWPEWEEVTDLGICPAVVAGSPILPSVSWGGTTLVPRWGWTGGKLGG